MSEDWQASNDGVLNYIHNALRRTYRLRKLDMGDVLLNDYGAASQRKVYKDDAEMAFHIAMDTANGLERKARLNDPAGHNPIPEGWDGERILKLADTAYRLGKLGKKKLVLKFADQGLLDALNKSLPKESIEPLLAELKQIEDTSLAAHKAVQIYLGSEIGLDSKSMKPFRETAFATRDGKDITGQQLLEEIEKSRRGRKREEEDLPPH